MNRSITSRLPTLSMCMAVTTLLLSGPVYAQSQVSQSAPPPGNITCMSSTKLRCFDNSYTACVWSCRVYDIFADTTTIVLESAIFDWAALCAVPQNQNALDQASVAMNQFITECQNLTRSPTCFSMDDAGGNIPPNIQCPPSNAEPFFTSP
jgi:hypothetical protein